MNLRCKTLLTVAVIMAVMILVLAVLSYGLVMSVALEHERRDVDMDLDRVSGSIKVIETEMARTATDWAVWNDTYAFVNDRNQSYIESNLGPETYSGLGINCLLIFDSSHQLVFGAGYNRDSGLPWDLSREMIESILDNAEAMGLDQPGDVDQGLIMTGEGMLMIAAHPITDNDQTMTDGLLVIGRYFDDRMVQEISDTVKFKTMILPLEDLPDADIDESSWKAMVNNGTTLYIPMNSSTVRGYQALTGVNGTAVGVTMVQDARETVAQATASMAVFHGTLVLISVAFCTAAMAMTDRFTTRRLDRFSRQVKEMGGSGDIARKIEMDGSDELAHLADEMNKAMDTIRSKDQALSYSERRYHAIVNDQEEMIFRMDEGGVITFANEALILAVHPDGKDVVGMNVRDLITPDQYEKFMAYCKEAAAGGRAVFIDHHFRGRPDGDRWISWSLRMIPVEGALREFQGVGRDLTEQKAAEAALALANKKLNLLASITRHDVMNKLTVAHGYVSIAKDQPDDPKNAGHLAKAEAALQSIEGYLEFTRDYQRMGIAAPVWINLGEAVGRAAVSPRSNGITVNVDVGDLEILTDPLVEKVFYNILDNAERHGGGVRTITVTGTVVQDGLRLTFEDDGVGIPEGEKEKIFEAGYGKNTGYGLFLAKEILGASGMAISERGERGKGARFEILVPSARYRHDPDVTSSSRSTA